MSVSKWNYEPDKCEGYPCPGDCDSCIHSSGMKIVWQHKDDEPIEVTIDEFLETQIELCLLGMEKEETE